MLYLSHFLFKILITFSEGNKNRERDCGICDNCICDNCIYGLYHYSVVVLYGLYPTMELVCQYCICLFCT